MTLIFTSSRLSVASFFRSTTCIASPSKALRQLLRHASSAPRARPKDAFNTGRLVQEMTGRFRPELTRFVKKDTPTVLVQASSPLGYRIGCSALAAFCFTWAGINHISVVQDSPHPLTNFVKRTFVSIEIGMAIFGVYCLLKTGRIISSVSTVLRTVNSTTGQKGLALRIETFRMIPVLPRKVIEVPADAVSSSDRLGIPGNYVSTSQPPTPQDIIEERHWMRQQEWIEEKGKVGGIFLMPFRKLGNGIVRVFMGLRDLFSEDSFVHIKIKDKYGTWKVDREFIWALDNGHAFDKIVKQEIF